MANEMADGETLQMEDKPTVEDMLTTGPDLDMTVTGDDRFIESIHRGYTEDPLFKIVKSEPAEYKQFEIQDGLIWTTNRNNTKVVCIPRSKHGDQSLPRIILDQAHKSLGHYRLQRTSKYTCRWYWWPQMVTDMKEFCRSCAECQQCKGDTKKPSSKLHTLPILMKPWDSIGMDFVGPFPEIKADNSRMFNYLWVIVCQMMSMVHLIPTHTTMMAKQLSGTYIREVAHLHGLPTSIVSDRDPKFTSKWWRELHCMLGS